jgi:serine/threonine protein kinase
MYTWHPQRRIGAPTNIWAVGNVMHLIMVHRGSVDNDKGLQAFDVDEHDELTHYVSKLFYAFTPTVATRVFNKESSLTFGHELLEGQCVRTYSKHLIQLVLSCLSLNPSDRPTARVIIDHAAPVLRYFDRINTAPDGVIDPTDLGDGGVSALPNSLPKHTRAERRRFKDDPQTVLPDGIWKGPDPRDWPIRPPRVGAPQQPVYFPEAVTTGRFRRRPERYVG